MLTSTAIEADFEKLLFVKNKLSELTGGLLDNANTGIETHLSLLKECWREEAKLEYERREVRLFEEVKSEIEVIRSVILDIDKASRDMYFAERNNYGIGYSRSY